MTGNFVTCIIHLLAVLPIDLLTAESVNPIKYRIFYVSPHSHVALLYLVAVLIIVEQILSDHQLVPVLIERHQKESQK